MNRKGRRELSQPPCLEDPGRARRRLSRRQSAVPFPERRCWLQEPALRLRVTTNPEMTVGSPIGDGDPRISCHGNFHTFPASTRPTSDPYLPAVASLTELKGRPFLTFPLSPWSLPFVVFPQINLSPMEPCWPCVVCPEASRVSNTTAGTPGSTFAYRALLCGPGFMVAKCGTRSGSVFEG